MTWKINFDILKKCKEIGHCVCSLDVNEKCPCETFLNEQKCKCRAFIEVEE